MRLESQHTQILHKDSPKPFTGCRALKLKVQGTSSAFIATTAAGPSARGLAEGVPRMRSTCTKPHRKTTELMLASWERQQSTEKSQAALPACGKHLVRSCTGHRRCLPEPPAAQDTTASLSAPCVGSAGHKLLPKTPTEPSLLTSCSTGMVSPWVLLQWSQELSNSSEAN